MKRIVLASGNAHKIKEISQMLPEFEVVGYKELGFDQEIIEDGKTFYENALIKAKTVSDALNLPALADDSGICVDALNGEPGIYSARYAGEHGDDLANNALLVKNLADKSDRTAHYTCAMALVYPDGREITAEGYMYGTIIDTPRGDRGFGYDPHFVMDGEHRTVAEMTDEEKNAVSHRANALRLLLHKIQAREV